MGTWHVISAFLIAGLALYGLGIPIAWLLPAPSNAQWVHRVAIAPPLAILVAFPVAWLMTLAGFPLNPLILVAMSAVAWSLAWRRNSGTWFAGLRPGLYIPPMLMIFSAGYLWFQSLRGYGLMLPNRDFKNHAYWVAQFAWDRFMDPLVTTRLTPISPPDQPALGRIGLQSLLGWALPTADWNSLGVTAAAPLLAGMISLPLGLIVLARLWLPQSQALWVLAGAGGVLLPVFTSPFTVGSVSLMFGAAVFPAAMASLWLLVQQPSWGRLVAFLAVGLGMAVTHIPEAAALGILAVLAIPRVVTVLAGPAGLGKRMLFVLIVLAAVVVPAWIAFTRFFGGAGGPTSRSDIQENTASLGVALASPVVLASSGPGIVWPLLIVLVAAGIALAVRLRMSSLPVLVLLVCSALSVGAVAAIAPELWRNLTLPWYGSAGRVSLLAGAPVVLLACLPLERAGVAMSGIDPPARRVGAAALAATVLAGTAVGVGLSRFVIAERRFDLAASLAGAGDTPEIARELKRTLGPGETVLNLESDGTANLFAAARVPVLAGISSIRAGPGGPMPRPLLYDTWLRLDHPYVQSLLRRLQVRYLAVGTRNVYWGTSVGYALSDLLAQPELSVAIVGTDMVVLRYDPAEGRP